MLIHHYLQRGFKPEDVINLSVWEKEFWMASMLIYYEEEKRRYEALSGGKNGT